MPENSNNLSEVNDLRANYDDFLAELTGDEKKMLREVSWDEHGTSFEAGLAKFVEENSADSDQAKANIVQFKNMRAQGFSEAEQAGDAERLKFFKIIDKLQLPEIDESADANLEPLSGHFPAPVNDNAVPENAVPPLPAEQVAEPANDNAVPTNETPSAPAQTPARAPAPEKPKEKIDLRKKIGEFVEDLPFEQRNELKKYDRKWENTDKQWMDGFAWYLNEKINRSGKYGITLLKNYIKDLKRGYEDISYSDSERRDERSGLLGEHAVMTKILGLYTTENKEEEAKKGMNEMDKLKSVWNWENIKFTMANIRRQLFEIVGVTDPWFDYSQLEKGMEQTEKQAKADNAPATAAQDKGIFNEFIDKPEAEKAAKKGPIAVPSRHSGGEDADSQKLAA
jgi:hypothetical protein